MSRGKGKGSAFERKICRQLSLWWTGGEDENVFWRTSNSGGRSSFHNRRGKKLKLHCGDVCAVHPNGQPFVDFVTTELKRGYNRDTIADLVDKPEAAAKQTYEKWFEQIAESSTQAGSYSWLLIVQRDRREPVAFFPTRVWNDLEHTENAEALLYWGSDGNCLYGCSLAWFLSQLRPERVKEVARELR